MPKISISLTISDAGEGSLFLPDLKGNPNNIIGIFVGQDNNTGRVNLERI